MTERERPPCIDREWCKEPENGETGHLRNRGCDRGACNLYGVRLKHSYDHVAGYTNWLRCAACRKEFSNDD